MSHFKRILQHPGFSLIKGSVISQILTFAALPIIARLYTPDNVGIYSLVSSYATFCIAIAFFHYDQIFLSLKSDGEKKSILKSCFYILLLSTLILSGLYLLMIQFKVLGFAVAPWGLALILLPIIFFGGISKIFRLSHVIHGEFQKIGKTTSISSVYTNATKVGGGFLWPNSFALLFSDLVLFFSQAAMYFNRERFKEFMASNSVSVRQVTRKFFSKAATGQTSVIIDLTCMMLPLQFLTNLYGASTAGIFAMSFRIMGALNNNIGLAAADLFQHRLIEALHKNDILAARTTLNNYLKKSIKIIVPFTLLVGLIAYFIFRPVFGAAWSSGGLFCLILIPWICAAFIMVPISSTLIILQKQRLKLLYDLSNFAFYIALYFSAQGMALNAEQFLLALSVGQMVIYFFYGLLIVHVIKRYEPHT
jgi:O-antigen/teichoic acid export membrane protein